MTDIRDKIAVAIERGDKATEGPLRLSTIAAPDDPEAHAVTHDQIIGALDDIVKRGGDGQLYSVTETATGENLAVAITGNGPTSLANAEFIKHAATEHPAAFKALLEILDKCDDITPGERCVTEYYKGMEYAAGLFRAIIEKRLEDI